MSLMSASIKLTGLMHSNPQTSINIDDDSHFSTPYPRLESDPEVSYPRAT